MTDDSGISLPGFEDVEGVEWVQKLPLFRSLSFDETRRLVAIASSMKVDAGTAIIEEDALGEALFIVSSGRLTVTRQGKPLGEVGPGELVGEMSLVDDVLTSSRVAAIEPSALLRVERAAFDALLAADAALAAKVYRAFCRTLADRLRKANFHVPDDKAIEHGVH